MTEWCVSYSEGYTIDTTEGGRSAGKHEVQAVVYQRGGDVEAIFVVGSNTGGAALARARAAARAAAWIAADPETRRTMQALERARPNDRSHWWQRYLRG